jgi:hypothetical protein
MLLGAVGCQKCDCKPCQACEAACDDTPSENFETVHVSVAGNENLTDGILEASGDTNPVPGYPGGSTGPYEQVISGSATLPGDRFPCYARLQLWRNEADQEPGGSPTMDLDYQYVLITCTVGKIRFGALELSAGESVWITSDTTLTPPSPAPTYIVEGTSIPLVGGDGDQSGSPPAFLGGTLAVQALCVDPVDGVAGVSFYAKIAWSEEAAYHVLYGRMVECYDETECLAECEPPETLYVVLTNPQGNDNWIMAQYIDVPIALAYDSLICSWYARIAYFSVPGIIFITSQESNFITIRFVSVGNTASKLYDANYDRQEFVDMACGGQSLFGTAVDSGGGVDSSSIDFEFYS